MPPDEFGDSGPTNVVAPPPDEPPLPAPADAAADTVVEDEEMVTSSWVMYVVVTWWLWLVLGGIGGGIGWPLLVLILVMGMVLFCNFEGSESGSGSTEIQNTILFKKKEYEISKKYCVYSIYICV